MCLFNLHTHSRDHRPHILAIHNVNPEQLSGTDQLPTPFSCGIHPWFIIPDQISSQTDQIKGYLTHPHCVALGEAGLDKLCGTPWALQLDVFQTMIQLSEEYRKPMIIHCVKAYAELLNLRKKLRPTQPWIIHGFRGNPVLAQQLISHGLYLSFGKHYNEDTLRSIPTDRFFLETDDAPFDLSTLYQQVSGLRGISLSRLSEEINLRAKALFGSDLFQNMQEK
ncbi:MAG: TatD family hydrolase [Bacteroidales bacterium]